MANTENLFDPVDKRLYDYRLLAPLLAEFEPDYSPDEPGKRQMVYPSDLLQVKDQIAKVVQEVNSLDGWDGNMLGGYTAKDGSKEKIESIRIAMKSYVGTLCLVCTIAARTPLGEKELDNVMGYMREQFLYGWGRVLNEHGIEADDGTVHLVAWRDKESVFQVFGKVDKEQENLPVVQLGKEDRTLYAVLTKAQEAIRREAEAEIDEMAQRVRSAKNPDKMMSIIQEYVTLQEAPSQHPPQKKAPGDNER